VSTFVYEAPLSHLGETCTPSGNLLRRLLSRTVPGDAFVKSFAQHILPTAFRKVRYYGSMASNLKTKLEVLRMVIWFSLGWIYWLASGHAPHKPLKTFPKVCCRACGAPLRVIAIPDRPIRPKLSTHSRAYLSSERKNERFKSNTNRTKIDHQNRIKTTQPKLAPGGATTRYSKKELRQRTNSLRSTRELFRNSNERLCQVP
jgi:hypothetical protein